MDSRKQKLLASLYGDPTPHVKKKASARAQSSSEDNPSIASLKRHPPPPRRLPAHIAAAGRAAGRDKSSSSRQSTMPVVSCFDANDEEEIDDGEEDNQEIEEEEIEEEDNEYIYAPDENDEDYNSYDHDDDMSEDDGLGLEDKGSIDISSREDEARVKGKKKRKKESSGSENSMAWKYFDKVWIVDEENPEGPKLLKARCLHCTKEYAYAQGSSTSTLNRHWKGKCKKLNAKIASQLIQSRLGFKPVNGNTKIPESTTPGHVGFDQAIVKELIAKMIMLHEYSFRMVEHEWFNIVLNYLNPLYTPMGRKAIRAECMRVYKKEKERLKVALQEVDYISLTTDLWTSNQTIAYMCVVAHYIDTNWKMQTHVLAFMELDPPHSGHVIADAVWDCVTDWKIENKVISITLDNASNNDVAVKDLKAKFIFRRCKQFEEVYFHVRCCAHIVNLVVQDGTASQAYPTANIFYRHIVSIKIALRKAIAHRNPTYKAMGEALMEKLNIYWEEKNNVMVLATILDPRYKMLYIDWAFKELYDEDTAMDEIADVRVELEELFDKFDTAKKMAEKSTTSSSNICITSSSMPVSDSAFQTHRRNTTTKSSKSELRNYLE
ncbi:hypothetical protein ACQ4PT_036457 [Festuca glaucescens]